VPDLAAIRAASGGAIEDQSGVGPVAAAVLTLVVLLIIGALAVTAIAAGMSHSSASGDDAVLTVSAPYHPGVVEAVQPAAPVAAAIAIPVPAPGVVAKQAPVTVPAAPISAVPAAMGGWTAARGVQIAVRALQWLNWPYSFDAGDVNGPTFGRAVDADSRNDAKVFGFDCSGLVIYALAPWHTVEHSAAAQYTEAGSFHPQLADLQPGDLVFWSQDGTIKGIGHVAVYIGGGQVIEAPQSGDRIKIMPLDQVEPGKLGLTRPLT
jgi:cell wall-associated NlpC family hydrolase